MMTRRREIEQSLVAERRLAALFENIWHLCRLAAEKALDQGKAAIRRAILAELKAPAIQLKIRAVARTIETSLRRQLAKTLGERIPKDLAAVEDLIKEWIKETMATLRALVVGGRRDAAVADAWRSLLEIASKARAGAETVSEAARNLGRAAASGVRRVRSAARSRALNLASRANKTVQKAIGIERYIWRTMQDDRVRPAHQDLNDTLQRWDDPPIAEADGSRYHPGEMHNCRCVAIPAR